MIEKIFAKLLRRKKRRPFSAWQIELTTRCPLQCKMCIRTGSPDWQYQDMPLEDFKKLLPYLKDVETVVLEGWGESLLYKDLSDCIRLVKKEGSQVGFVTSAKGLTEIRASELIEAGLDFIGFSIAGTTPETHDAIRVNSHLPEIQNAIQFFNEKKARQNLDRPKIHLVFLILKDNILEVPKVPSLANEVRIDEIVLINLIHVINDWQDKQRVFIYGNGENEYEKILKEAETNALKLNIKLAKPSLSVIGVPICAENPLRNLYVSVDGEVSPCVYLYPPLPSPFKRIFCQREHWMERMSFGNIFKESFSQIWNRESYIQFRQCFTERNRNFRELSLSLWNGNMRRSLKNRTLPDPPKPCKTCHKILGV